MEFTIGSRGYLPWDWNFVKESNAIEGIKRDPKIAEMEEYLRFMALDKLKLKDIEQFVHVYQPAAQLRERRGMNVQVGRHIPPAGDITVKTRLIDLLEDANVGRGDPECCYLIHQRYESLHPFMDGNGRSGRMLWRWMMIEAPFGFLRTWYYMSLQYGSPSRK